MQLSQVDALLLLALVATSVLPVAHSTLTQAYNDISGSLATPQRSAFRFPKLLNFSSFKKLFNKSYRSPGEASNRQKIFLSHVFQSFLSMLRYSHKKSTHYLSVNEMSDWSPKEFKQTLMEADTYYVNEAREHQVASILRDKEIDSMIEETLIGVDNSNGNTRATGVNETPVSDKTLSQVSEMLADMKRELNDMRDRKLDARDKLLLFGRMIKGGFARLVNNMESKAIGKIYKPPKRRQDLPDEVFFDHSKTGCLGPPKNQRECGSCYIFGTLAFYEWAYCREFGQQVRFSEQYVLDCGRRIGMQGCQFGSEAGVSVFSSKYGFELMNDIFYMGRESICPYDKSKDDVKKEQPAIDDEDVASKIGEDSMGMYRIDNAELMRLEGPQVIELQLSISPVIIMFRPSKDYRNYGGGVDLGEGCQYSQELHTVLIVGSGRQDGYEYWLARNSYGSSWGEKGHWKIAKNSRCYSIANLGMTTKALNHNAAPKAMANSTIPLVDLANQTDQQVLVYNFTMNPKHNRKYVRDAVTRILHQMKRM